MYSVGQFVFIYCIRPALKTALNPYEFIEDLRWLDWIFLGGYLPSLSINYVAMSKDMGKRLPQLYYRIYSTISRTIFTQIKTEVN